MRLPLLRHVEGLRYAVDIFLGTAILWVFLRGFGDRNPVWAIISFIVVSDPDLGIAKSSFILRLLNTLTGCATGILFLVMFGPRDWMLPPAIALTVLICTNLVRPSGSWRIAPATSALVITSALAEQSSFIGFEQAFRRAGEVVLGSLVALLISWMMSRIWTDPSNQIESKKPHK